MFLICWMILQRLCPCKGWFSFINCSKKMNLINHFQKLVVDTLYCSQPNLLTLNYHWDLTLRDSLTFRYIVSIIWIYYKLNWLSQFKLKIDIKLNIILGLNKILFIKKDIPPFFINKFIDWVKSKTMTFNKNN